MNNQKLNTQLRKYAITALEALTNKSIPMNKRNTKLTKYQQKLVLDFFYLSYGDMTPLLSTIKNLSNKNQTHLVTITSGLLITALTARLGYTTCDYDVSDDQIAELFFRIDANLNHPSDDIRTIAYYTSVLSLHFFADLHYFK